MINTFVNNQHDRYKIILKKNTQKNGYFTNNPSLFCSLKTMNYMMYVD